MKVESKFNVNDLIQYKYQKQNLDDNAKSVSCFEVMEVIMQTCYGGTQIFYDCRPIHMIAIKDYEGGKVKVKHLENTPGFTDNGRHPRLREDEVKACCKEISDLVLSGLDNFESQPI